MTISCLQASAVRSMGAAWPERRLSRRRRGRRDFIGSQGPLPGAHPWLVGAGRWRETSLHPHRTSPALPHGGPRPPRASGGGRGRGGSRMSRAAASGSPAAVSTGSCGSLWPAPFRRGAPRQGDTRGGGGGPAPGYRPRAGTRKSHRDPEPSWSRRERPLQPSRVAGRRPHR